MFAAPENFSAFNATAMDAAMKFARISLQTTEQYFNMGVEAGREVAGEAAKATKSTGEMTSFKDFVAAQTKTAEKGVDKAITLSKSFMDVAQQAQKEYAAVLESKVAEMNKVFMAGMDQTLKTTIPGADAAIAAFKSTAAAGSAAFDNLAKMAKQTVSAAEAEVQAVTEAVVARAKSAKAK